MSKMDPFLRGFSEQFMDIHLEEKEIQNIKGIINIFKGGIKSNLDAEIGFLLGYAYAELLMQFLILKNRLPNKDESSEYYTIMKRRFPEIIQQIKKQKKSELLDRDDVVINVSEVDVEQMNTIQE